MNHAERLRQLLADSAPTLVPGVYDGVSAKLAQEHGFLAAAITGYGLEASLLGRPDMGLATMSEVVGAAGNIAATIDIPVICDVDTGYGGPANVWRTISELRKAGVAGAHIEDQASPKKCGGLSGRTVVDPGEMSGKIRAAVEAAEGNLAIIARTDARATEGVNAAVERLNTYLEAGASAVMVAEHYELEELAFVAENVNGPLVVVGGLPGWPESLQKASWYGEIGVSCVIYALVGLYAATRAIGEAYRSLGENEGVFENDVDTRLVDFPQFNDLIDLQRWEDICTRFS